MSAHRSSAEAAELAALTLLLLGVVWRLWELAPDRMQFSLRVAVALGIAALVGLDLWRSRKDGVALGLAPARWRDGWGALGLATLLGGLLLAGLGSALATVSLDAARFGWLRAYVLGLLGQQLLLQCVFNRRIYALAVARASPHPARRAVVVSSGLFAALHAPNPALMIGVLFAGLGWTAHFLRFRNLPALLLSHAALGVAAMVSLGPGLMLDLRVGGPAWERLRQPSGAQVGGGERVGVLVPARPSVSGDPHQLHPRARGSQPVELLDQLEVGDRPLLAAPTAGLPSRRPLVDGAHTELTVGIHRHGRIFRKPPEGLDQRSQLHAVVGGGGVAPKAFAHDLVVFHPDRAPPTGAGVAFTGAVCEDTGRGPGTVLCEHLLGGL